MSAEIWIAAVAAVPPTVAVVYGIIAGRKKLRSIHIEIDGRLDELLETTREVAEQAGARRGRAEERLRQENENGNDH